ncbi:MAG: glycosyltransferase family 2 protein [Planctomycetota bacterium]
MIGGTLAEPKKLKPAEDVPRIVWVVLNWNGLDDTRRCLDSLLLAGIDSRDIWVVDNGSSDGSAETLEREFPAVRLFVNGSNLGYCEGNNVALREALVEEADYIGVLNNDAHVAIDFLEPLLSALDDPGVGVVGPKILFDEPPHEIWCAGAKLGFHENLSEMRGFGEPNDGRYAEPEDVDYVPGAALLAPHEVWEKVGLFEPSYFAYMEDVDWCCRVRAAGWRVRYVPGSIVYHKASGSTGGGYSARRKYMTACNEVHFLRRHGTLRLWAAFWILDVALWPVVFLRALGAGRTAGALGKLRGIWDGLRGRRVEAPAASSAGESS